MKQTIEIEVPEGFEAKYNPEENKIELVKKDSKPRTWKEYCETANSLGKFYISSSSNLCAANGRDFNGIFDKNLCTSLREAEAFLALMQLRQLRKAWVGDWEPDYSGKNPIWHIHVWRNNSIEIDNCATASRPLSFPTKDMAEEFFVFFNNLIEQAKILL